MQEVFENVYRVSPTKATVLLLGESGTGKELIAKAIHYMSPRSRGPFIKFNCASIPEGLLESELFGHEKGAFTGAIASRKGKFELANKGTILLDEIGDLPIT
ncbi:MAG: sigma-54 factor interaction domain-containing protein, partial [Nitrospiraceae bacterium]